MNETELKLLLDDRQERLLRSGAAVRRVSQGRARTRLLHSVYYDTEDHALARAGIALRLRKDGGRWIQTVKKSSREIAQGLSTPMEDECRLPKGELDLARIADDDLRAEVVSRARPGLSPSVETAFRRTSRDLSGPDGGRVELAIDVGEVRAGGASEAFREAELEVKEGSEKDLFALARALVTQGPVRFSNQSKAARAARLRDRGRAVDPPSPRKAAPVSLDPEQDAGDAATAILREVQEQIASNVVATVETDEIEGPHQLRVGLRRLRSTLGALRPAIGCDEADRLRRAARAIGVTVGRLRDLDVFADEILPPAAAQAPEEPGFARLVEAVAARRVAVREEVRQALAAAEVAAFVFDLASFTATQPWRDDLDDSRNAKIAKVSGKALDKRWKALKKAAGDVGTLTPSERHEMRKEIKKVRYLVDFLGQIHPKKKVVRFREALKSLQDDFGALNDAAMVGALLCGPDAPAAGDPDAQRAAGRIIGRAMAEAEHLWPRAVADWRALAALGPFWR